MQNCISVRTSPIGIADLSTIDSEQLRRAASVSARHPDRRTPDEVRRTPTNCAKPVSRRVNVPRSPIFGTVRAAIVERSTVPHCRRFISGPYADERLSAYGPRLAGRPVASSRIRSSRRQASRSAGRAAEIRAGRQSQDRHTHRPHPAVIVPRPRRRGIGMSGRRGRSARDATARSDRPGSRPRRRRPCPCPCAEELRHAAGAGGAA